MNTLIERIRRNTEKRKRMKERIDGELNLSVENDADIFCLSAGGYSYETESNRLIDEGAIIEGDCSVYAYIKKGTLSKFMNRQNVYLDNLPEDFVGNINIGHHDHASWPFPVGKWQMSDMSLVDTGNGRQGIDINVTLDDESMFIKELKRLGNPISMSIEALFHIDEQASEDLGIPIVDEVFIFEYAVVGDGKNVNSNGLELKGESNMTKDKLAELKAEMETPETEEAELSAEVTEEETIEEEVITEETEEVSDEDVDESEPVEELSAEEEPTEDAETAELSVSEEAEGEEGIEDAEEAESEEATYEDVEAFISELQEQVKELSAENAELKKTNNRLQKKLKAEKSKKDEFVSKFASVAKTLGVAEETHEQNKVSDYVYGDGIGE